MLNRVSHKVISSCEKSFPLQKFPYAFEGILPVSILRIRVDFHLPLDLDIPLYLLPMLLPISITVASCARKTTLKSNVLSTVVPHVDAYVTVV